MPSSTAAGGAGRRAGVTVPLQLVLALCVVSAMVVLGTALIWQGWRAGRDALLTATRERAQNLGIILAEQAERRVAPASLALSYLASGPMADMSGALDLEDHPAALQSVFASVPFLSAVAIGDNNGNFVMLQRIKPELAAQLHTPAETAYVLGSTDARTPPGAWRFRCYDAAFNLIETRDLIDKLDYDPRQRGWFSTAVHRQGQFLSSPYRFALTGEVGVTLSEKMARSDGVIGLDVALSDLDSELAPLKPTPHAEIVVVTATGAVLAYAGSIPAQEAALQPLRAIRSPVLDALEQHKDGAFSNILEVDGETWFGSRRALVSKLEKPNELLIAIPERDILGALRSSLISQLWAAVGITLLLVVAGWFVGRKLGRGLGVLAQRAQNITRFDFSRHPPLASSIREIAALDDVLDRVCETVRDFLTTSETIATEPRLDRMLQDVLARTVRGTSCTRGAVYLLDDPRTGLSLAAEAPELERAGAAFAPALPLGALEAGPAPTEEAETRFSLPLRDREGRPLGLLVLAHENDASHRGGEIEAFARKLSGALAVSIEARQLIENQRHLLDGFIRLIADAIDAKSPYTGAHCRRVPELAAMIVERMATEQDGPYRTFSFGEEERRAFHLGA